MSSIVLFINLTARASADWLFWLFLQTKFIGERMLPGGNTVLDDAEGNGFLLWRNHFSHVVLVGVRILSWQWAFILGSNTICFRIEIILQHLF